MRKNHKYIGFLLLGGSALYARKTGTGLKSRELLFEPWKTAYNYR